jgi:hypothetical protein
LQDLVPNTRLHRRVTAFEATGLRGPVALYGNRVGLPPRATLHLDQEELSAVLAHELGHIIRRDPGWLVVLRVVESVLWIQPLNRVARREFQTSAEFLADEWALQRTNEPLGLARSLEKVAGWMVEVETAEPVLAMARAESPIVDRVRRILRYSDRSTPRSLRSLSAALLLPAFLLPPAPLTARAEFRILIFEEATDVGDHVPVAMPEATRELHVEYSVTGS